jgi:molybdate transport system substrate-binding protein
MKTVLYGVAAALAAFLAPAAGAAEIKVIASNAVREPYRELIPVFEKETASKVAVDWGGTVDIVKRVAGGEVADIVIIPTARIDDFVNQGKLAGRIDLAKSGVGVAVRAGAPHPDISSA